MLTFVDIEKENSMAVMMRSNTLNKGENKVVRYERLWDITDPRSFNIRSFRSP